MATNISTISFSNPNKVAMAYADCAVMRNLKPKFKDFVYKPRLYRTLENRLVIEVTYTPNYQGTYTATTIDLTTDPDLDDNDIIIRVTGVAATSYSGYEPIQIIYNDGSEWWGNYGSAIPPMGDNIIKVELLKGKVDSIVADFSSASYNNFAPVITVENNGTKKEVANFATVDEARAKPEVEIMPAAEGIQGGQILLTYGPGQGKTKIYLLEDTRDGTVSYVKSAAVTDLAPWKNGKPLKIKSYYQNNYLDYWLLYSTDDTATPAALTAAPVTIDETKEVLLRVKAKVIWGGYYLWYMAYPTTTTCWIGNGTLTNDKKTTDWIEVRVIKGSTEKLTMNFSDSSRYYTQWVPKVISESGDKVVELTYPKFYEAVTDRFAPLAFSGDKITKYDIIKSSIDVEPKVLTFSKSKKEIKLKVITNSSGNDYTRFALAMSKSLSYVTTTGPTAIPDEPNACEFTFTTTYDTLANQEFYIKTADNKIISPTIQIGFTPDKIINYDLNGGVDMISTYKVKDTIGVGEEYTIPKCTLLPPVGKSFSHWNTSKDDKGTKYEVDQKVTFDNPDPITLFPIWKAFTKVPGKGTVRLYLLTDGKGSTMRYAYNCIVGELKPWKGDKQANPVSYYSNDLQKEAYILYSTDQAEGDPAVSSTMPVITDPAKQVILRIYGTGFRGSGYLPYNISSSSICTWFNAAEEQTSKDTTKFKVVIEVADGTADRLTACFGENRGYNQWTPHVIMEGDLTTKEKKFSSCVFAYMDKYVELPLSGATITKPDIDTGFTVEPTTLVFNKNVKSLKLKFSCTSSRGGYEGFSFNRFNLPTYVGNNRRIEADPNDPNVCYHTVNFTGNATVMSTWTPQKFQVGPYRARVNSNPVDITVEVSQGMKLIYDMNGGKDPTNAYVKEAIAQLGEEYTFPECTLMPPTGKMFSHWSTAKDTKGTNYNPGDKITFDKDGTTTLYPIWKDFVPTPGRGTITMYFFTGTQDTKMSYAYNYCIGNLTPWKNNKPVLCKSYYTVSASEAYLLYSTETTGAPTKLNAKPTNIDQNKEVLIRVFGNSFRYAAWWIANNHGYGQWFNSNTDQLNEETTKYNITVSVIDGQAERLTACFGAISGYNNWAPNVVMYGDTEKKTATYTNKIAAYTDYYHELPLSGATVKTEDIISSYTIEPEGAFFTAASKSTTVRVITTSTGNDITKFNLTVPRIGTYISASGIVQDKDKPNEGVITLTHTYADVTKVPNGTWKIQSSDGTFVKKDIPYGKSTKLIVKYHANGGTGTMEDQTIDANQLITLSTNKFTPPAGKVFDYWTNKEDGIKFYHPEVKVQFPEGSDVNLYAKWRDAKPTPGKGNVIISIDNPNDKPIEHANTAVLTRLRLWVGDKALYLKNWFDVNQANGPEQGQDVYCILTPDETYKDKYYEWYKPLTYKPTKADLKEGDVLIRMGADKNYPNGTSVYTWQPYRAFFKTDRHWSYPGSLAGGVTHNVIFEILEGTIDRVTVNFADSSYNDLVYHAVVRSGDLKKEYNFNNWEEARLPGDFNLPFSGQRVPEVKDIVPTMKIEPDLVDLSNITTAGQIVTVKLITNSPLDDPYQYFMRAAEPRVVFPGLDLNKVTFAYGQPADAPKTWNLSFGIKDLKADNNSINGTKTKLTTPQMGIATNEITFSVKAKHKFIFKPTYASGTMEEVMVPVGDYTLPESKFVGTKLTTRKSNNFYNAKVIGWSTIQEVWNYRTAKWTTHPTGTDVKKPGDVITTTSAGETVFYTVTDKAPMDFVPYRPAEADVEVIEGTNLLVNTSEYGFYTLKYEVSDPKLLIYSSYANGLWTFKTGNVDKDTVVQLKYWYSVYTQPELDGKPFTYNVKIKAKVGYLKIDGDGGTIDTKAMGYDGDKGIPVDSEKGISLPEPVFLTVPPGKEFKIYSYYQGNQAAHNHIKPGTNYKVPNGNTYTLYAIWQDIPKPAKPADVTVEVNENASVEITLPELDGEKVYEWTNPAEGTLKFKENSKNILVYTASAVDADKTIEIPFKVNDRTVLSDEAKITVNVKNIATTGTFRLMSNNPKNETKDVVVEAGNVYVPENTFTYDGWEFKEWDTKEGGNGIPWRPRQATKIGVGQITILYAQWTRVKPKPPVLVEPAKIEVGSGESIDFKIQVTPVNMGLLYQFEYKARKDNGTLVVKSKDDTTGITTFTYTAPTVTADRTINTVFKAQDDPNLSSLVSEALTVPILVKAAQPPVIEVLTKPDKLGSGAKGTITIKEIPNATITATTSNGTVKVVNNTTIEVTAPTLDQAGSIQVTITATREGLTDTEVVEIPVEARPIAPATVKFVGTPGTGTMKDVSTPPGDYTIPDSTFTPEAKYEFKSWNTKQDGSGTEHLPGSKIKLTEGQVLTLYAVYEKLPPEDFTLEILSQPDFIYSEETGDIVVKEIPGATLAFTPAVIKHTINKFTITVTAPKVTKDDKITVKVSATRDGLTKEKNITIPIKIRIYYKTVKFNPNTGTGTMKDVQAQVGKVYTLPPCTFTPPKDKRFKAWSTDATGKTLLDPGDNVNFNTEGEVTYYAIWEDIPSTKMIVHFDPNTGTGTMPDATTDISQPYVLPASKFTPPKGKIFRGWTTDPDSNKIYNVGDKISFAKAGEVTFFAIWKDALRLDVPVKEYTVNDGEIVDIPYTTNGDKVEFTAPKGAGAVYPDKISYTAPTNIKASESIEATIKATRDKEVVEVKIKINIVYVVKYHTIKFNPNGGSGEMLDIRTVINTEFELPKSAFTPPEFYEFAYWSTLKTGLDKYLPGTKLVMPNEGETTYYAIYKLIPLVFYTKENDKEVSKKYSESVEYVVTKGATIQLEVPKNKGMAELKGNRIVFYANGQYEHTSYIRTEPVTVKATATLGEQSKVVNITFIVVVPEMSYVTIRFNGNGGQGEMPDETYPTPDDVYPYKIPEPKFTPPKGHKFQCWNTKRNGSGTDYLPGSTINLPANKTTILFAKYKIFERPATPVLIYPELPLFVRVDQTLELHVQTKQGLNILATIPQHMGTLKLLSHAKGIFKYLYIPPIVNPDENIIATFVAVDEVVESLPLDLTITVEYNLKYRTIKFLPNGGTGEMKDRRVEIDKAFTFPASEFTPPEGMRFKFWSTDDNAQDGYVKGEKLIFRHEGTTTYKALWEEVPVITDPEEEKKYHGVKFDPNGGIGKMDPVKVEIGKYYYFPDSTFTPPPDKDFLAWSTDLKGDTIVLPDERIKFLGPGQTTYYALWRDKVEGLFLEIVTRGVTVEREKSTEVQFVTSEGASVSVAVPGGKGMVETKENSFIFTAAPTYQAEETVILTVKAILNGQEVEEQVPVIVTIPRILRKPVTFEPNGSTSTKFTQNPILGIFFLPMNTFTPPEQKEFKAWSTTKEGKELIYPNETVILDTEDPVTYYAIWQDIDPNQPSHIPTLNFKSPLTVEPGKSVSTDFTYTRGSKVNFIQPDKGNLTLSNGKLVFLASSTHTTDETITIKISVQKESIIASKDLVVNVTLPKTEVPKPEEPTNTHVNPKDDPKGNITFHPNGAKGSTIRQVVQIGQKLPKILFTPPTGKKFVGWSEHEEGNINFRLPESVFKDMGSGTADLILYAVYVNSAPRKETGIYDSALPQFAHNWDITIQPETK